MTKDERPGADAIMTRRPRIFSSRLTVRQRRVYRAAVAYFLFVAAAMMWPVYPLFSHVRPFLLGMPLALFYLAFLVILSFLVAVLLYRWELRHGLIGEEAEPDRSQGGAAVDAYEAPMGASSE